MTPEAHPDLAPRCLKCGSDSVVPDVRLVDYVDQGTRRTAELGIETKPDAVLFKGEVRVETRARVCGDCGFVEVYAADPAAIWDAYVARTARELGR